MRVDNFSIVVELNLDESDKKVLLGVVHALHAAEDDLRRVDGRQHDASATLAAGASIGDSYGSLCFVLASDLVVYGWRGQASDELAVALYRVHADVD